MPLTHPAAATLYHLIQSVPFSPPLKYWPAKWTYTIDVKYIL